jgi:hypothetical protein
MLADREPFWARNAPTLVLMTVTVGSFPALNLGDRFMTVIATVALTAGRE